MKRVLITGGTGSLGKSLIRRFQNKYEICVFSRCEEKHVEVKKLFPFVKSYIGDVRDYGAVYRALITTRPEIVINAAALKNIPECELFPEEALKTNTLGTCNVVRAIESLEHSHVERCILISTDKGCKPTNAYAFSKAFAERIHLRGQGSCLFNAVRYGNVLESRGSVIPFFKDRIKNRQTLPVTDKRMTRFLLSLNQAVDLIEDTLTCETSGNIYIPRIKSCNMYDLARAMCLTFNYDEKNIEFTKARPGEKINEIMVSEEECYRTEGFEDKFIIHDVLADVNFNDIHQEYSSGDPKNLMDIYELILFLNKHGVF